MFKKTLTFEVAREITSRKQAKKQSFSIQLSVSQFQSLAGCWISIKQLFFKRHELLNPIYYDWFLKSVLLMMIIVIDKLNQKKIKEKDQK